MTAGEHPTAPGSPQGAHPAPPATPYDPGARWAPGSYAPPDTTAAAFPGSTVALLVVSLVSVALVGVIGIPSAVIAVLAWRQHGRDPVGAQRRTSTGWVTYAVNAVVGVLLLVPFYLWVATR